MFDYKQPRNNCRVGLPDDRDVEGHPAGAGAEPGRVAGLKHQTLSMKRMALYACNDN